MNNLVDIKDYTQRLTEELKMKFGKRLLYVGLQGSYLRGEATLESDIDIMLVFDKVHAEDLNSYRQILLDLGEYERACGFVCGRDELLNWFPEEICHILHTTSDIYGKLKCIVPNYSKKDVADYIKMSVGNLYHMLCHRRIHSEMEKNVNKLPLVKRDIFFILQNLYYLEDNNFIETKSEVASMVKGIDLQVWECFLEDVTYENIDQKLDLLLDWCKDVLKRTSGYK
ncbi:nucleotidyltransferase domain-containing protein [Butyrivibrio sp. WCD2001]|uniref:nucleotidyltransferase domain-containing protein n=1 Tax=Butyrivibrio sp. WCD2001 TaxID=1280681 RepID=UPI0003FF3F79|nr:nucleotidyltransferase domain-containing protein [Butyrivibrio sp. WCD2001]